MSKVGNLKEPSSRIIETKRRIRNEIKKDEKATIQNVLSTQDYMILNSKQGQLANSIYF